MNDIVIDKALINNGGCHKIDNLTYYIPNLSQSHIIDGIEYHVESKIVSYPNMDKIITIRYHDTIYIRLDGSRAVCGLGCIIIELYFKRDYLVINSINLLDDAILIFPKYLYSDNFVILMKDDIIRLVDLNCNNDQIKLLPIIIAHDLINLSEFI